MTIHYLLPVRRLFVLFFGLFIVVKITFGNFCHFCIRKKQKFFFFYMLQ